VAMAVGDEQGKAQCTERRQHSESRWSESNSCSPRWGLSMDLPCYLLFSYGYLWWSAFESPWQGPVLLNYDGLAAPH
jgi:hypothetical protein